MARNCLSEVSSISLQADALCVRFSPAPNNEIAVGCSDGAIRIFNSQPPFAEKKLLKASTSPCTGISFIPSESRPTELIAVYTDGARRWHVPTRTVLRTIPSEAGLLALDVRPDGVEFVAAGESEYVYVFPIAAKGEEGCKLGAGEIRGTKLGQQAPEGHTNRVFAVKWHPAKEHVFFSAGWDRTIQVWDTRQTAPLRHMSGPYICGDALSIDVARSELVTGSYLQDGVPLQVWDLETGEAIAKLDNNRDISKLYACQHSKTNPDLIATAGAECNELRIIDRTSGNVIGWHRADSAYYSCDFNASATILVGCTADRSIVVCSVGEPGTGSITDFIPRADAGPGWTSAPPPPITVEGEFSFELRGDSDDGSDDSEPESMNGGALLGLG